MATDRLILRRVEYRDVPALVDLWRRAAVREFLGGSLTPEVAHAKAIAYVNAPQRYVVVRHDGHRFVGLVSLTSRGSETELSYEFLPGEWGQGLGSEACAALLGMHASAGNGGGGVVAATQRANHRSRRLLERLGMTLRDEFVEYGADQVLYSTAPDCP